MKRSTLSLILGIISYGFRNLFEGFKAVVKKIKFQFYQMTRWNFVWHLLIDKFSGRSSDFGEGLNVVGDHPTPLDQLTKKTLRVQ